MFENAQNMEDNDNKKGRMCGKVLAVEDMRKNSKSRNNKQNVEFRYYEMPAQSYLFALLGERWILNYGTDAMHFHNYLEIGYCYYGEGEMIIGGESYNYRGQMFTVIPRNCPHCTRSEEQKISRWEYLFIDVNGFLEEEYKERPMMLKKLLPRIAEKGAAFSAVQHPELARLIRGILEEMRSRKEFHRESVRGYLLSLLVELARRDGDYTENEADSGEEKRIAEVLDYIAEHFAQPIKIAELAALCHISETHFRRVFERVMNVSPSEYINMIRIQHACSLLQETSESIEAIREKSGFSTASTFNRNFMKLVQMSPGQWRAQKGGGLADYKISIYKGW